MSKNVDTRCIRSLYHGARLRSDQRLRDYPPGRLKRRVSVLSRNTRDAALQDVRRRNQLARPRTPVVDLHDIFTTASVITLSHTFSTTPSTRATMPWPHSVRFQPFATCFNHAVLYCTHSPQNAPNMLGKVDHVFNAISRTTCDGMCNGVALCLELRHNANRPHIPRRCANHRNPRPFPCATRAPITMRLFRRWSRRQTISAYAPIWHVSSFRPSMVYSRR